MNKNKNFPRTRALSSLLSQAAWHSTLPFLSYLCRLWKSSRGVNPGCISLFLACVQLWACVLYAIHWHMQVVIHGSYSPKYLSPHPFLSQVFFVCLLLSPFAIPWLRKLGIFSDIKVLHVFTCFRQTLPEMLFQPEGGEKTEPLYQFLWKPPDWSKYTTTVFENKVCNGPLAPTNHTSNVLMATITLGNGGDRQVIKYHHAF